MMKDILTGMVLMAVFVWMQAAAIGYGRDTVMKECDTVGVAKMDNKLYLCVQAMENKGRP